MSLIDSLRQAYPMYNDRSDQELIDGYLRKFHPDKTQEEVEFLLQQKQSQPINTRDDFRKPTTESEGVLTEFAEGLVSGAVAIPQGILELGASAVDLAADTDYASSVTEAANKLRENAGIDPVGLIGKGTEAITQFVVPGLGAASAVSKVSKLGRLRKAVESGKGKLLGRTGKKKDNLTQGEKLSLGAQQLAAAGAADAVVATDGITTIADFFEGGPTQTNQETGLSGREEALRRLSNKLSIGAETGAATLAIPAALGLIGRVLTEVPGVKTGVQAGAKGLKSVGQAIGKTMSNLEDAVIFGEAEAVGNTIGNIAKVFRYRGFLPQEIATQRLLTTGTTDAIIKQAKSILSRLDKEVKSSVREASKVSSNASPLTEQSIFNNLEEFMIGSTKEARERALSELPDNVQKQALKMRGLVQSLNNDILNSDYMKRLDNIVDKKTGESMGSKIRDQIEKNIHTYLRRRYRVFEDAKYQPTKEVLSAAAVGFKSDRESTLKELSLIALEDPSRATSLGIRRVGGEGEFEFISLDPITDAQAEIATRNFLNRHKPRNKKTRFIDSVQRVADIQVNPNIFRERSNMADYKRALLGEIKDTKEAFLGTVSDLSQFVGADNYFSTIRRLADENEGIGRLFKNTQGLSKAEIDNLKDRGFKILDDVGDEISGLEKGKFGSLQGYAVPEAIYNDLTRLVIRDSNVMANFLRDTYSSFLRAKGVTQFGKTVLSPITQIRNVTTASLFAAAQGNIGRGANLGESLRLVYNNLFTDVSDDVALKNFQELQKLGVVGSQAELREIQQLLQKGLGYTDDASVDGIPVGRKFGSKITDTKLGSMVGNIGKSAANLYQAGDDIWKIYNYTFELNKLRNAYRGVPEIDAIASLSKGKSVVAGESLESLLKKEAADIVRNTVPNYNMAPEFIRTLRRAPVGNFIAFPYEILRTGVNTIARGIDELASDNVNIRKIGLRRLTGAATTFGIAPAALSHYAHMNSGVTKEQMDAYQRSAAPSWEKNARLIPTGRNEKGFPTYINYSYSNPYDLLERSVNGALNKIEEGKLKGQNGATIAALAANEAIAELFEPFTEEAIITAKIRDVLDPKAEIAGFRQAGQLIGGRGGRTMSGAFVYSPEDDAGTKAVKSFAHVLDAIIPSIFPVKVSGGEFEATRFAKGVIDSVYGEEGVDIPFLGRVTPKDRYGRERELTTELLRAFTGITELEVDVPLGLQYKGYAFAKRVLNSNNMYTKISNRKNATSEDFIDAYRQANEAKFRVQKDLFVLVEDMRTMGLEDKEIKNILKKSKVGDLKEVMRGEFKPVNTRSSTVRKNLKENNLRSVFPRSELKDMEEEYEKRTLKVEPKNSSFNIIKPAGASTLPSALVAEPIQSATPQAGATASIVPPNTQAQSVPVQPRDPFLLGGNPIDVLKNQQIAQRLQGQ